MNKHLTTVLCLVLFIIMLAVQPAAAASTWNTQPDGTDSLSSWPTMDQIEGISWVVYDRQTDEILLAKNPDQLVYPASTTKIMTALLALEAGNLNQTVNVSATAVDLPYGSSKAGLIAGEQIGMRDILAGLMLASGNDAANSVAETLGGSEVVFAALMNQKAADLGMTGSHFMNASGLHDDNHYVTARDMAILADTAMANSDFRLLVETKLYSMPTTNMHPYSGWGLYNNTNRFLQFGDTALKSNLIDEYLGIKTGSTQQAGYNLISAARTKSGHELIAVLLGVPLESKAGNVFMYSRTLLETAAAQIEPTETTGSSAVSTETTTETAAAPTASATETSVSTQPDSGSTLIDFVIENPWRSAFWVLLVVLLLLIAFLVLYIRFVQRQTQKQKIKTRRV